MIPNKMGPDQGPRALLQYDPEITVVGTREAGLFSFGLPIFEGKENYPSFFPHPKNIVIKGQRLVQDPLKASADV